ncbi:translation initiation factor IF-2-like [Manacus candei]|uniref:translation initiation factor IF-2-like n=1 Tax=Manacus candei TaxID=415023 RepID=UPI0022273ED3|nr:translation initiation factor IF-2-like [Manacus candei]
MPRPPLARSPPAPRPPRAIGPGVRRGEGSGQSESSAEIGPGAAGADWLRAAGPALLIAPAGGAPPGRGSHRQGTGRGSRVGPRAGLGNGPGTRGINQENIRTGVSSKPQTTELTRVQATEVAAALDMSDDIVQQLDSDTFNAITEKLLPIISQTHLLSFLAEFQISVT